MREIKFREWVLGDSDQCPSCKPEMRYFTLDLGENWIEGRLMQFTGLKDKNGKEIYEGDVLSWSGKCQQVITWEERNEDKTFGHGDFGKQVVIGFTFEGYYGPPSNATIVGNIYENPELINV